MRDGVNPSFQFKIISASEIPPIKVYLLKTDIQAAALSEIAEALVPAAYISALNQILVNYNLINSLRIIRFKKFVPKRTMRRVYRFNER